MTQTDEADLMPYPLLRDIEYQAIKMGKSPLEVYRSLSSNSTANPEYLKKSIRKFFTLWSRNQWKRERMAPAFNFDDFNVSPRSWYRFPILSGNYLRELIELDAYGA
jgi:NAD+ synthase (glutamine-hydrolysing)